MRCEALDIGLPGPDGAAATDRGFETWYRVPAASKRDAVYPTLKLGGHGRINHGRLFFTDSRSSQTCGGCQLGEWTSRGFANSATGFRRQRRPSPLQRVQKPDCMHEATLTNLKLKAQEGRRSFTRQRTASKGREGEAEPTKFSSDLVPDPRQAIPAEVSASDVGLLGVRVAAHVVMLSVFAPRAVAPAAGLFSGQSGALSWFRLLSCLVAVPKPTEYA